MSFSPTPKSSQPPSKLQQALGWVSRLGSPPVLSTVATGALVLGLRSLGAFQGLELGVYDQMMRRRPAPPPDERILVVGISEQDVQARQEWPIQDETVATLLDILVAAEPRAVGLDMFRDVPIGEGRPALQTVIQNNSNVFTVCKMSSPDTPGVPPPPLTPELQVGFSDLVVDPGGILRRNLLIAAPPADSQTLNSHLCNSPEAQLFSLSLQLALGYLAVEGIAPALTADQELQIGETVLPRLRANMGGYNDVDASGYQTLLNYRAARTAVPQVSLADVLSGQVPEDQIRDRVILVGATTPEAKDEFYTPFSGGLQDSQKMPGVVVHAQSVSQILSAVLDDRPLIWSWPAWGEAVWIVVWGLGGALFAWYVRRPLAFAAGTIALLVVLYGCSYLFFLQGGWIPLVPAAIGLALAAGVVILLDRFNKSDYGQAVYKQMKSLLRLEIDIDKTKVGQQVAEITDTDYFNRLQAQAKELREKRREATLRSTHTQAEPGPKPTPETSEGEIADELDDYVSGIKERANRLQSPDHNRD